jgi:hypothetical protein
MLAAGTETYQPVAIIFRVFSNSLGTDAFMVLKHCIKVRIQLGF